MMIEVIYFYTPDGPYGVLSNFSRHGIDMDGFWWPTVEHYFQAQKFEDKVYQQKIRSCSTPKQAAELGRSRKVQIRSDWEQAKVAIMKKAVLKKFQTHKALNDILVATSDAALVENAPGDYFWGCGQDGTGHNWLGKILEEVRGLLRDEVRQ